MTPHDPPPQHDLVWPNLTVEEHLTLVSRVRADFAGAVAAGASGLGEQARERASERARAARRTVSRVWHVRE